MKWLKLEAGYRHARQRYALSEVELLQYANLKSLAMTRHSIELFAALVSVLRDFHFCPSALAVGAANSPTAWMVSAT